MPDAIDKFIKRLREDLEARLRSDLAFATTQTQSPIEALFAAGVMALGRDQDLRTEISFRTAEEVEASRCPEGQLMFLCPQSPLGPYRIDFICMVSYDGSDGLWWKLAVECDGHAFHDMTVEQASRDRARDRYLQDRGIPIYRFTGTDLNRDLYGCSQQVVDWAWQKLKSHFNEGLKNNARAGEKKGPK